MCALQCWNARRAEVGSLVSYNPFTATTPGFRDQESVREYIYARKVLHVLCRTGPDGGCFFQVTQDLSGSVPFKLRLVY